MKLTAFVALLLVAGTPAFAQPAPAGQTGIGNPGGENPLPTNDADRTFVTALAKGGMAEVDAGRLAGSKSDNADVKSFAQRMVADHEQANAQLASVAHQLKLAMPADVDPDQKAMQTALQNAGGDDFNRTYMQGQVTAHQQTTHLLEYEVGSGQNATLKKLAADLLPVVRDHLAMAQAITAKLTGGGKPTAARP